MRPLHTVYVVNQKDDDLSAVNTNACNGTPPGRLRAACSRRPFTPARTPNRSPSTRTPRRCTPPTRSPTTSRSSTPRVATPTITSGCRQPPPCRHAAWARRADRRPGGRHPLRRDRHRQHVSMINSRTCNAYRHDGCTPTPPTVTVGAVPGGHRGRPADPHGLCRQLRLRGDRQRLGVRRQDLQRHHHQRLRERPHPAGPGRQRGRRSRSTRRPTPSTSPYRPGPSGPSTVSVFNGATCNASRQRRLRPGAALGDGRIRRHCAGRQHRDRHHLRRQLRSERRARSAGIRSRSSTAPPATPPTRPAAPTRPPRSPSARPSPLPPA